MHRTYPHPPGVQHKVENLVSFNIAHKKLKEKRDAFQSSTPHLGPRQNHPGPDISPPALTPAPETDPPGYSMAAIRVPPSLFHRGGPQNQLESPSKLENEQCVCNSSPTLGGAQQPQSISSPRNLLAHQQW